MDLLSAMKEPPQNPNKEEKATRTPKEFANFHIKKHDKEVIKAYRMTILTWPNLSPKALKSSLNACSRNKSNH